MAKKAFSKIGRNYRVTLKNGEVFLGRLLDKIPQHVDDTKPLSIESLTQAKDLLQACRNLNSPNPTPITKKETDVLAGVFETVTHFKFDTITGVKEYPFPEIEVLELLK